MKYAVEFTPEETRKKLLQTLLHYVSPPSSERLFVFDRIKAIPRYLTDADVQDAFVERSAHLLSLEMARCRLLGADRDVRWSVTEVNSDYRVCPSYPAMVVVPAACSDEDIERAAKVWAGGRFPVWRWSSQSQGAWLVRASRPLREEVRRWRGSPSVPGPAHRLPWTGCRPAVTLLFHSPARPRTPLLHANPSAMPIVAEPRIRCAPPWRGGVASTSHLTRVTSRICRCKPACAKASSSCATFAQPPTGTGTPACITRSGSATSPA